jgi:aspartyl-tRNA(Asn)/glutamyl-tRNA(Gln) amidotransferase subunit A
MTRTVEDAHHLWRTMADLAPQAFAPQAVQGLKLLAPTTIVQDGMDEAVAEAFQQVCQQLSDTGIGIDQRATPELAGIGQLYERYGNFARAESFALYEDLIRDKGELMDDRVAKRMLFGQDALAADYIRLGLARAQFQEDFWQTYSAYDAIISPTVAILPPRFEELNDDKDYFRLNGMCLRNTSLFNFLGVPAISVPAGQSLPIGVMVAARPHQEDLVLALAKTIEALG